MTTESRPAVCDYCKLPLPVAWWDRQPRWNGRDGQEGQAREEPLYCCLGCQIAAAILEEKSDASGAHSTLVRLGLAIFCTMNVMAFTMALWTDDVYGRVEAAGALSITMNGLFRYLVLLFSLPVLFFLGLPLFRHAWNGLMRGVLSTDWLLASGVAAAFLFSFLSVARGHGPIYFEVGCVILVMTTLGRWLEANGKLKANAALDVLTKLLPEKVRRVARVGQPFHVEDSPRRADVPGAPGESLNDATRERAGRGVGQPFQADVRLESLTYEEQWAALADVQIGDLVRVLPGERFPVDGQVAVNRGLADEQVLTGESRPVLKEPGDRVLGGTLNLDGELTIRVSAVGEHGTLARLVAMVHQAREAKGRYQRLADRVASRFVPAVFAIAFSAIGFHWALGSLVNGLWAGLAVTLIACPCALGLAAPLAIWSALGNAASRSVLFRSGEALERLAEIVAVRFDKTGTLTTGTARLSHWIAECDDDREAILARAAALAAVSSHALSRAIVGADGRSRVAPEQPYTAGTDARPTALAQEDTQWGGPLCPPTPTAAARDAQWGGPPRPPTPSAASRDAQWGGLPWPPSFRGVTELRIVPGMGIRGLLEDTSSHVILGSARFASEEGFALGPNLRGAIDDAESHGLPLCVIGWDGQVRGLFVFSEEWRPAARAVTSWLSAVRMDVGVLTGDHAERGRAIADELGVGVEAELLPDQKVTAIERVHRTIGPVCMVGDGINDAPALAASDVGIALGCGADVSRDSASVCLLGDDLSLIPWCIELARRTRQVIRWNLIWAFGYNTVGIGLAAVGWLNPALAAFLMVASSALVTMNSLRLSQPFAIALDEELAAGRVGVVDGSEAAISPRPSGERSRQDVGGEGVVERVPERNPPSSVVRTSSPQAEKGPLTRPAPTPTKPRRLGNASRSS
jgi:heavy metal translocating P-type ATPase